MVMEEVHRGLGRCELREAGEIRQLSMCWGGGHLTIIGEL